MADRSLSRIIRFKDHASSLITVNLCGYLADKLKKLKELAHSEQGGQQKRL
jgi:hypothetical protein